MREAAVAEDSKINTPEVWQRSCSRANLAAIRLLPGKGATTPLPHAYGAGKQPDH